MLTKLQKEKSWYTLLFFSTILIRWTAIHGAQKPEIHIAVAANFTQASKEIVAAYETEYPVSITVSYGSTGQLYAQILHGAPYQLFLAADTARPYQLAVNHRADIDSRRTYARGKLVLWSTKSGLIDSSGMILHSADWRFCSIANPKTAPYGAAAVEVLLGLNLWPEITHRVVTGSSITQSWQHVASGSAEIGFVALSQVIRLPESRNGSQWLIPESMYTPLLQQMVKLPTDTDSSYRDLLYDFILSSEARFIIESFGYSVE